MVNNKLALFVVAVVIAAVSFYGGMYYAAMGGRIFLLGNYPETVVGEVTVLDDSSLTLKLGDGSTKTLSLGPETHVLMMTPAMQRSASDVTTGAQVVVVFSGDLVQQIQLFSPSEVTSTTQ